MENYTTAQPSFEVIQIPPRIIQQPITRFATTAVIVAGDCR